MLIADSKPSVKVVPAVRMLDRAGLDHAALLALASGGPLVLHVRQFVHPTACATLAHRAESHGYSSYLNVPSVRRIGMAFYETESRQELLDVYFDSAQRHIREFRAACLPYASPIDAFRCTLDEAWAHGARLQTLGQRKMFVGLSRMVEPGTTFLAHHDIFEEDAPGRPEASGLLAQFGANIYLQMPDTGGSLLMWRREIPPSIFNRMRGADYGVAIERLGAPDATVTPAPGDLLIFNSRKMHAVSPGTGRSRLAVSCFVGYRGPSAPLTFWS